MKSVNSKSPLRLGLAGGGTDVSPYSEMFGGHVLNATITLYTYCTLCEGDAGKVDFYAADFNQRDTVPLYPACTLDGGLLLHRAVYRRIVNDFLGGVAPSLRVVTYSDAPPGSGVGSSSSLVVAMVQAYVEYFNLPLGEYDVAHLAHSIERADCLMSGGKQDQYAAAFGGFNFIEFGADDRVVVNPLRIKPEIVNDLEAHLLLYFTGRSRESAKIIEAQIAATSATSSDALDAMHEIKASATAMKEALLKGRVQQVLQILGGAWMSKKRAAQGISNSHIDELATAALEAGAISLKISGAGGGGFMMIGVAPQLRFSVIRALEPRGGRFFPFSFHQRGVQSWKST